MCRRLSWVLDSRFRPRRTDLRNWKGIIYKGPYCTPEMDPLMYVRIPRNMSGLPVDLYVMDSDRYLKTRMPLVVLFSNNYGDAVFSRLVPITVSRMPKIPDPNIRLAITTEDFRKVRDFIRNGLNELKRISSGPPSAQRTYEFMKLVEKQQHKEC